MMRLMYLPSHFAQSRVDLLQAFIRDHPLAALVISDEDGLTANHIPLVLRPDLGSHGRLLGHVARANPLWRKAANGIACLAIFQGTQGYISPNHYATKRETGKVVPTWNYDVVHVHGTLRAIDDVAWLREFVTSLTRQHEAHQPVPWKVTDAPAEYVDRMLTAIVGIEIEIARMVGKAKLSQNQPQANRESLVAALRAAGDSASVEMADAVEDHAPRG
jgi:transcriptional regulator